MKLRIAFISAIILICLPLAANTQTASGVQSLCAAYNDLFRFDAFTNTIVWMDGTHLAFGSERAGLSFDEQLQTATLWDQMSIPYPRAWPTAAPAINCDPGRMRCDAFFRKMYGNSAAKVEQNLVRVPWPAAGQGRCVRFTKVNGANKALESVGAELAKLSPTVRHYVSRPNGTFHWRVIEGTDRPSPHSYGIAIDFDISTLPNQYWRWTSEAKYPSRTAKPSPSAGSDTIGNYPTAIFTDEALRQIVEIFERHGFIWGGKWYHYDIMHFEYRPELLRD